MAEQVVIQTIGQQVALAAEEARKRIKATAEQICYYLADGQIMKEELAEKYGITEEMAQRVILAQAVRLADDIRKL
jgi:hypothetical protein